MSTTNNAAELDARIDRYRAAGWAIVTPPINTGGCVMVATMRKGMEVVTLADDSELFWAIERADLEDDCADGLVNGWGEVPVITIDGLTYRATLVREVWDED